MSQTPYEEHVEEYERLSPRERAWRYALYIGLLLLCAAFWFGLLIAALPHGL